MNTESQFKILIESKILYLELSQKQQLHPLSP